MATAPRDDLIRMTPNAAAQMTFEERAPGAKDGSIGTLEGYAAVFNADTIIDSHEGKFMERIAPGAFAKTLSERSDRIKVLFNHGFDPSIGDKPLGKPASMVEDDYGLRVRVPLDDTSYNRDLVASLKSGALDGQSFRFSVKRESWVPEDGDAPTGVLPQRTLREVQLYEFGPVTFPAYEATTAGVRARPAYLAWRSAQSNAAHPGTLDTPDAAASVGTAPAVKAPLKERAILLQRVKELAK